MNESFHFLVVVGGTGSVGANASMSESELKGLLASLDGILLASVEDAPPLLQALRDMEWTEPCHPWLGTIHVTEAMLSLCSLLYPSMVQGLRPKFKMVPLDTPVSYLGLFELTALFAGGWMGTHCNWRITSCHGSDVDVVYISPRTQIQCLLWKPLTLSSTTEPTMERDHEPKTGLELEHENGNGNRGKANACILLWNPASRQAQNPSFSIEDQYHALRAFIVHLLATVPFGSVLHLIGRSTLCPSVLSLLHLLSFGPQAAPCVIKVSRKWKKIFDWMNVHSESLATGLQDDLYLIDRVLEGKNKLPFAYQTADNEWIRLEKETQTESGRELRIVDVEDWHATLLQVSEPSLAPMHYSLVMDPDLYPTPQKFAACVMEQRYYVDERPSLSYAPLLLNTFCQGSGTWVTDSETGVASAQIHGSDVRVRAPGETVSIARAATKSSCGIKATMTAEVRRPFVCDSPPR